VFLKKDKRPNGRIFLSIVQGYRDPNTGKVKHKTVKSLGYLDSIGICILAFGLSR